MLLLHLWYCCTGLDTWDVSAPSRPSLKVAIRQPLLDYGTSVGLHALKQHVEDIAVPMVKQRIDIPVIGKILLKVDSIRCVHIEEPGQLTHIAIVDNAFHATAQNVSATFSYHWKWEADALPLHGSGSEFLSSFQNITVHSSTASSTSHPRSWRV
jgi:hypothetical protein